MCLSCLFSKKSTYLFLFILIILSRLYQTIFSPSPQKPITKNPQNYISLPSSTLSAQLVKVVRVIDGDTIEIDTGQKVRYIGINSPELHNLKKPVECFARQAFDKNKQLVEGKIVKLEKDVSQTDKYGRLLRYVFVPSPSSTESALFVNEYLVAQGYALISTFPPDIKYAELFRDAQQKAMKAKLGLWKDCR